MSHLGLMLLIIACTGPSPLPDPPMAEWSVSPDTATPGSFVRVTLTNISNEPIFYNLLCARLQVFDGTGWTNTPYTPYETYPGPQACPLALWRIRPGESDSENLLIQPVVPPGRYRFDMVFALERMMKDGSWAPIADPTITPVVEVVAARSTQLLDATPIPRSSKQ